MLLNILVLSGALLGVSKGFQKTRRYTYTPPKTSDPGCNTCFSDYYEHFDTYNCTSHPESLLFKFDDDIPKEATILGGEVVIYGTFNCNPPNDMSQQKFRMILNDNFADDGNAFAPNTGGCWCKNCAAPLRITIPKENFHNLYYTGDTNMIKFFVQTISGGTDVTNDDNFICISKWCFDTHFEIQDFYVYDIIPRAGPTSGGTNVTIYGTNFSQSLEMYCSFGKTLVKALYVSSNILMCTSPNALFGLTTIRIGAKVYDEMVYANTTFKYNFYADLIVNSVNPDNAPPTSGKKKIAIKGNFVETGSYKCKFKSRQWNNTVIVSGTFAPEKEQITCIAPKWDREETVYLSVTINNQQFSDPARFRFVQKRMNKFVSIVIGSSCIILIVLTILSLLIYRWVHHRRENSGYEHIKDGNIHADISDISMGKRIGKGTIGEVYKGMWRGTYVAVKRITITGMSEDTKNNFERDIRFMQDLRSPNIVQFMGCAFEGDSAYILTEYMPRGSLYNILHNNGINRKRKATIFNGGVNAITGWPMMIRMLTEAARGMTYLHTCAPPVIHKNLKSFNLLVDEFWGVKVCDYNLSSVSILLSEREANSVDEELERMRASQKSRTIKNRKIPSRMFASWTLAPWTAPEVLEKYAYSTKSDTYSFGIVMWECLTRNDPYDDISLSKLMYSVLNENLRPEIPPDAPAQYVDLMKRCWDENPANRPPFNVIITKLNEMTSNNWDNKPWGRQRSIPLPPIQSATTATTSTSTVSRSTRLAASVPSYSPSSSSSSSTSVSEETDFLLKK